MNTNVLCAVFKRNFVSYFANPTGYVFICVFVLLSAFAAFWPNEFFNANLATLDQLNGTIPFILLFFVPAITMSVWAEESRLGTDELLLTIPAGDFEIVLGKYLAAVAIFSASLLFSLVCNFAVLQLLGDPDRGLFVATYFGYWMLGLAMLSVGMVASFLTRNLTVAYILGAAFNAPLVFMGLADAIPAIDHRSALAIKQWSFGGQFQEFGRGIIGFSGFAYFVLIVAVMLYLSMVLIGRRHWVRSGSWHILGFHFFVRTLSLAAITVGAVYILHTHDVRLDATSERLSSLSPDTIDLIRNLETEYDKAKELRALISQTEETKGADKLAELNEKYDALKTKWPVKIEAFISAEVPESYIQTRLNLLTVLRELQARSGGLLDVQINLINESDQFGAVAETARQRYNIVPRNVTSTVRGAYTQNKIFLGVVFTCGLEKVVLPFVDRGLPVEYELVRSICTVTQQKRKRIGVIESDVPLFGRVSMQGQTPGWPIITELQNEYDVVQVNPAQPIPLKKAATKPGEKDEGFDVLLAIQPSAMGPQEMMNFQAAVRSGQPTVIFEDPFTFFAPEVPGTSLPRRPADPMMAMFNRQPLAKGDIKPLWQLLGVGFSGEANREDFQPFAADEEATPTGSDQIVWQNYNPYPKLDIPEEFVFIDRGCGQKEPFCETDPISSKLQNLFFPGPGYIEKHNTSELNDRVFTPLIRASANSGTVRARDIIARTPFGQMLNPGRRHVPGRGAEYVLAAHITGLLPAAKIEQAVPGQPKDPKADNKAAGKDANINVVLVADIDMLTEEFFRLREQGEVPGLGLHFDFDNVTLVLNALDSLAGDTRFLELRKRRPQHRTLTKIDKLTEDARKETNTARDKCRVDRDEVVKKESQKFNDEMKKLAERIKKENANIDQSEVDRRVEIAYKDGQQRSKTRKEELDQDCNTQVELIDAKMNADIRRQQDWYKMWAVLLPPIPPLLVGLFVYFSRRSKEREGVSQNRMR